MLYAKELPTGNMDITTTYSEGAKSFPGWEELFDSFSIMKLLKSKFSWIAKDFMDPNFRDILEEIEDYNNHEVVDEAMELQRENFNWSIETLLKRNPYVSVIPKGIPKAITSITIDYENELLTWFTDDEFSGELDLTHSQARRLSKENSVLTTYVKKEGRWSYL